MTKIKALPRSTRHQIYKDVLKNAVFNNFKDNNGFKPVGICYFIGRHPSIIFNFQDVPRKLLPEMQDSLHTYGVGPFRPYWFDLTPEGNQQRIQLLEQWIEQTKPKSSIWNRFLQAVGLGRLARTR